MREAKRELLRRGEKVNIARLCVLSGLYRKDFDDPDGADTKAREGNLVMRVLGLWEQGDEYVDRSGKPRILSYRGEDNEFQRLAASVTTALSSGTILFQLERMGAVEKTPRGLKLTRSVQFVQEDLEMGFEIVTKDIDGVIRAAEENLLRLKAMPNLHIRTEYDNVSSKDLPNVQKWVLDQGKAFQRRMRKYLSKFDRDIHPKNLGDDNSLDSDRCFISVGTFSLSGDYRDFYQFENEEPGS